ncbi:MAG: glycosyltransferase [Patescibacteria group bacterium]|nr:glycosyltransferase [Patescibacteria group bacterium]MDD5554449.1 glycosyltransferase [Patescibacteria group bacterium]
MKKNEKIFNLIKTSNGVKMIYLANARIPTEKAHGRQIMKMGEAFAEAEVELGLIVPWRFSKIKASPFSFYGVREKFRITKIFSLDLVNFGRAGFWIQIISFLAAAKIYLVFRRYDILYTREQLAGLFFKDFILELHSLPENISEIHKKIWAKAKKLIVLTDFIKNGLIESGISADKILIAPDGVDLKEFDISMTKEQARGKLDLPKGGVILGYTGSFKTMGMDKGISDILEALKIILNSRQDILFLAIGGNEADISYYGEMAKNLGVENNIFLIPRVGMKELAVYQKACDILLMPFPYKKHYAFYMSPIKMFEYMASRRPIITSDLPAVRGILNEDNAFFVKPDDPESLAKGIKGVLQNRALADKILKKAYQDVKDYTWEKRAINIIKFIK